MNIVVVLLAAGVVLGLLALLLLLHRARARARRAKAGASAPVAAPAAATEPLMEGVRDLFAGLTALLPDGARRYELPLVLLAAGSGAGKSTMLATCHLGAAAPRHPVGAGDVAWHAFEHGTVLEAGADCLGLDLAPGAPARAWDALADAMQRYRPRRPADAVIVAVAADVLTGPREALVRLAEQTQRRLARMQVQFGLRLPLYVVITKADLLPGFTSFAHALPPALRDGMLGWSNPEGGAATFNEGWADAAFDAIGATVSELMCERMAAARVPGDAPGLLGVGTALETLRAPAASFIAHLAGAPEPQRTPLLRGIYVTGNDGQHALFAKDLLACKVFAERGMAQPLPGQVWARDRRVRSWRLATGVLVGLWLPALVGSGMRLNELAPAMVQSLTQIRVKVLQAQREHGAGRSLPPQFYRDTSKEVIAAILARSDTLLMYAIPASWHWPYLDSLDDMIEERFADGVREILLPAIGKGLNQKVVAMTGAPGDRHTTELKTGAHCSTYEAREQRRLFQPDDSLEGLEVFQDLSGYVDWIGQMKGHLVAMHELQQRGSGTVAQVAGLAKYTQAFDFPASPAAARPYYLEQALLRVTVNPRLPTLEGYVDAFTCGLKRRHDTLTATVLSEHPLLERVAAVDQGMHGGAPTVDYAPLQTELVSLKRWLSAPGSAWLHTRRLDFGGAYAGLLDRVDGLDLPGPVLSKQLRAQAEKQLQALEHKLTVSRDPASPVLQRSSDAQRLEMTPPVAHMERTLSELMQQPFMALPDATGGPILEAGAVPLWDLNELNALKELAEAQRAYLAQALGTVPVAFQPGLRTYADARLKALLLARIDAAQSAGQDRAAAYAQLGQAHAVLLDLLKSVGKLGGEAERQQLAARLAAQAEAALAGIDADFDAAGLYLPKTGDFAWWSGSRNPAIQGYTNGDAAGLDDYLAAQLDAVQRKAALARPVLALYMDNSGARSPLAKRWESIDKELERYTRKEPGARIAALHGYIRGELSELDLQNCQGKALTSAAGQASDFFGMRMRELGQRAARRCVDLARSGGSAAYGTLAAGFRGSLANRFPFAHSDDNGMAAEPEDVAAFLGNWELLGPAAKQLRADGGDTASLALAGARRFVAAGDKLHAFLAPLLAPEPGAEPGYDLKVRFRVDEKGDSNAHNALAGEVDGNRIAEWKLTVGDQVLRFSNGEQSEAAVLRWRFGMPVALSLRWAANPPALPLKDPRDPYMALDGRVVTWQFDEPWSLLRLLSKYRVDGARGETLRFRMPVAPGDAARGPATVFMRLSLSPAGKKTPLAFPPFPVDAPDLGGAVMADGARPASPLHLRTGTAK